MAQLKVDLSQVDDVAEVAPTRIKLRAAGRLTAAPLSRIRQNDLNPRTNFGDDEDLRALGRSIGRKQLQAIRAVSRSAYVELFPEFAESVPEDIDVIIVNGERRYRAALLAELPSLEVVIDDDLANSRKEFIDAVMAENIDRQNFDAIEEAQGIELLVKEFGSADAVAVHYGRSKGWVSQRRSLLKLSAEVQALVRSGEIPVRKARELAAMPADSQLAEWEASKISPPVPAAEPSRSKAPSAGKTAKESKPTATPAALPWDSPAELADIIIDRVNKTNLAVLVKFLQVEAQQ